MKPTTTATQDKIWAILKDFFMDTVGLADRTGKDRERRYDALFKSAQTQISNLLLEAELSGRADELVKLSEWGKTIDDQWNAHFKDRLKELKAHSKVGKDE